MLFLNFYYVTCGIFTRMSSGEQGMGQVFQSSAVCLKEVSWAHETTPVSEDPLLGVCGGPKAGRRGCVTGLPCVVTCSSWTFSAVICNSNGRTDAKKLCWGPVYNLFLISPRFYYLFLKRYSLCIWL